MELTSDDLKVLNAAMQSLCNGNAVAMHAYQGIYVGCLTRLQQNIDGMHVLSSEVEERRKTVPVEGD